MIAKAASVDRGPIRVGNGAGFWGDNLDAPYLLARDGQIDVLTLEYLAELTMATLRRRTGLHGLHGGGEFKRSRGSNRIKRKKRP